MPLTCKVPLAAAVIFNYSASRPCVKTSRIPKTKTEEVAGVEEEGRSGEQNNLGLL